MELIQLRYFINIAEARSFTEAAKALHVSQPALSYQIKRLENELGARLFERTSRKVALTLDGQAFYPLAQGVLSKADEAVRVMRERLGAETGEVTFGTLPSVAAYVVPHILASFRRMFPGIKVHLVEAGTHTLERSVINGEIDFAITGIPLAPEMLEITPLLVEELVVVVPVDHELAKRNSISLRELASDDFILLGGPSFTFDELVVEACHRAGFEPMVAYRTGTLESVRSFVSSGLGVTILPRLALQGPRDETIVDIPLEEPLTRDVNLIRAKHRYVTVATRTLMVHVRSAVTATFANVVPRPWADGQAAPRK